MILVFRIISPPLLCSLCIFLAINDKNVNLTCNSESQAYIKFHFLLFGYLYFRKPEFESSNLLRQVQFSFDLQLDCRSRKMHRGDIFTDTGQRWQRKSNFIDLSPSGSQLSQVNCLRLTEVRDLCWERGIILFWMQNLWVLICNFEDYLKFLKTELEEPT